jgi:hypothetical protein
MTAPLDESRKRQLLKAFRMPSPQTMTARKTSITNAFVNAILPRVSPSADEIDEALRILGMVPTDLRCAYCGDPSTEWDHLRPLVLRQRPTGYISEIANLVPACGKCNQSKRNAHWRDWMLSSSATLSPTRRGLPNVAEHIARLEAYERWRTPMKIEFEAIVPAESWDRYWASWARVNEDLRSYKEHADAILRQVVERLGLH